MRSVPFLKAFSESVEKKIKIFYYIISKNRGALIKAEIIPVELRMKFQPDPDNAGGGRYEKIFYFKNHYIIYLSFGFCCSFH